jgi:protein involved in polysaccharide export with SLBB domain
MRRAIVLALALLALAGCENGRSFDLTRGGTPSFVADADPAVRDAAASNVTQALSRGTRSWRLQPGDTIDVLFSMTRTRSVRDYRIGVGDQIEVVFLEHPALSRMHTVRPDGRISLSGRGEMVAAGMRPADLGRVITERYGDDYVDARATVHVVRATDDAEQFMTMISGGSAPRAQTLAVAPDGTVTFPMLQPIRVSGLTIEDVQERSTAAYRQRMGGIGTSVRLASTAGQLVFVFGEVQRPGPQPATPQRSILQLVAASGGPTEFAAIDQVRVMYWDEIGQPSIRVANLNNVLQRLALEEDMAVPAGAVIFVPPSALAQAGRMVDQVVRRLFLFNGFGAGIYFNENLNVTNSQLRSQAR